MGEQRLREIEAADLRWRVLVAEEEREFAEERVRLLEENLSILRTIETILRVPPDPGGCRSHTFARGPFGHSQTQMEFDRLIGAVEREVDSLRRHLQRCDAVEESS